MPYKYNESARSKSIIKRKKRTIVLNVANFALEKKLNCEMKDLPEESNTPAILQNAVAGALIAANFVALHLRLAEENSNHLSSNIAKRAYTIPLKHPCLFPSHYYARKAKAQETLLLPELQLPAYSAPPPNSAE